MMDPITLLLLAGALLPIVTIVSLSLWKGRDVPLEERGRQPTEHEMMVAEATDRND
jgi:hypothetical protein